MNIKTLGLITIIFIIFSALPAVANIEINTITDMPNDIVAGSTYQVEYAFTTSQAMNVSINFSVIHIESDFDNWDICYVLNNTIIVPYESAPGQFTSGDISVNASEHNLIITFSSIPNLTPGDYTFEIEIISDEVTPTPTPTEKRSSRGGGSYTVTPTPTPTPNATATPIATTAPSESVTEFSTPAPINVTAAQTYLTTDYRPHIILGGMIFLLAAIITLIVLGRKKRKAKEAETLK